MYMHTQHIDRNIGPHAYSHLKPDQLLVTSIFYTIQGEGPYAGVPAVFVRLAGCNRGRKLSMGCAFCDTRFHFDKGLVMSFEEIRDRIIELLNGKVAITVITGGEPMLQDNLSEFVRFHRAAFPARSMQVESNGDRLAKGWPERGAAQVVVSPKVTGMKYHKPKDEVLRAAMCLKFVISADPLSPYYTVPDWALGLGGIDSSWTRQRIYVSPMTIYKRDVEWSHISSAWDASLVDHEATRKNYNRTAALALEHGLRVSMQQHLFYELE